MRTQRWRWLGHPGFLGVVVLLAVNDQILKDRYGTWWTGKISDVAGLVVIGIAASVVLGARPGLVTAGLAFTALKTVPGVAEAVAPVLGGVTLRDPTDLLALGVLIPMWWWLGPARSGGWWTERRDVGDRSRAAAARAPRATAALAVVGATVAVFACTATSCVPDDGVVQLVVDHGALYAGIAGYDATTTWARSDDGGRTWRRSERPAVVPAPPAEPVTPTNVAGTSSTVPRPRPLVGPTQACGADGTCFDLEDQERIVRTDPDGTTEVEYVVDRWATSGGQSGCGGSSEGVLASIQMAPGSSASAIASLGTAGVVVRNDDGEWEQRDVLEVDAPPPKPDRTGLLLGVLANGLVVVAVGVVGRMRRWPSWVAGTVVSGLIWAAVGFTVLFLLSFTFLAPSVGLVLVSAAVNAALSVAVARSSAFARRPPPQPGPWQPVLRPDLPPPPDPSGSPGSSDGWWRPPPAGGQGF